MFTFIDLFAGIGGTRLAFDSAGGTCVYTAEWDKFARQTYAANFFTNHPFEWDITQVNVDNIPDHDVLVGGFPCQPFSKAGHEKGFQDTRGTLFFDIARILEAKRPKAFMLENVPGILKHDKGYTFEVVLDILTDLGYNVSYDVLQSEFYVPQKRDRVYIIGHREKYITLKSMCFFNRPVRRPQLKHILEPIVDDKYTLSDSMWDCLRRHKAEQEAKGNGFSYGLFTGEDVSRTLLARYYKDGSEILIQQEGKNPRKLTPRECARLMGFPNWFKIPVSNTQAYKQFGNSVVVPLVKDIALHIEHNL